MGWRRLLEGDGKGSVVSMMGVVLRKCWGVFFSFQESGIPGRAEVDEKSR